MANKPSFESFLNVDSILLNEPVPFEEFKIHFDTDPSSTSEHTIFLTQKPDLNTVNNTVLDENDQKAFSSFLDAFFLDPNMQPTIDDYYFPQHDQEEEIRKTSILQSLDEQKKLHQKRLALLSNTTTNTNNTMKRPSTELIQKPAKKRYFRELLTDEEKRANHIASEQKRRGLIRSGFKELTELIPSLKHINNSKSTVLFKAAEFISQLERKNNHLRDKIEKLELRVKTEGKLTKDLEQSKKTVQVTEPGLPTSTRNALVAHKSQQKQLLLLQEQLQIHQKLIAQRQEMKEKNIQKVLQNTIKLPPILGQPTSHSSLLKELEDKAIRI